MSTSGVTTWELNRDELIATAYRKIGIPGEDNTLSTTQLSDGASALNSVIALAATDGMPLWKRTTTTVTPSTTSQVYTISSALKIAQVVIVDSGGTQWELQWKSEYDFNRLPQGNSGIPVNWKWSPSLSGLTVSIWPLVSDTTTVSTKTIKIVYQKKFDGVVSSTDTLDFPSYWTLALVYRTACLLAPEHGVPLQDRQLLEKEAAMYWAQASSYGDEDGSLFIQPEKRYG